MPDKLRFKVAVPDSPTAPLNDETVWIDFEPAFMDENLRRLVRSRINLEVTIMRDLMGDEQFSEGLSRGGSIPSNYWAPEPMDVCKGEYNREAAGVMPKGHYESNGEWIPDHTIA